MRATCNLSGLPEEGLRVCLRMVRSKPCTMDLNQKSSPFKIYSVFESFEDNAARE